MNVPRRTSTTIALAITTALALAACGSSTQDATAPAPTAPVTAPSTSAAPPASDIVGVASSTPGFTNLVAAATAAGLVPTLQGTGPFTVFAPTDAAFATVKPDLLANLLKPANKEALTKVLTYHVVAGKLLAADLKPGTLKSVEGNALNVTADTGQGLFVNNGLVTTADVPATNGVVHVIDHVLFPPDIDLDQLS